MVLQAEYIERPDMQGTFLPLHLLTRVVFKLDASCSFIVASCVMDLGIEVETFREARCGCSSLGCRVRVDLIGWDCELEISKIRLIVDLRDWGFLRELFRGLTNNIIYRSVSTTTSESCPYDTHRRIVHIISIVGACPIDIGGLSTK